MKITANIFSGGRDTDTEPSKLPPNRYRESYNIELVSNGEKLAAQGIDGTTQVKHITDNARVLGVYPNVYKIDNVDYNCLTIFTLSDDNKFKIWCYNTETTDSYEMYEETVSVQYDSAERVVGADNYPENGVDFLYFTDNFNELRFLKCEITFPYTPNFLTESDVSLLRRGANGKIEMLANVVGGNLLTGTYQFAYRMLDPTKKRFTKWSNLTWPIQVGVSGATSNDPRNAGIGLQSGKKLTLLVTPTEIEVDNFGFIQLAVVENVNSVATEVASLLEIQPIVGPTATIDYVSNTRIGTIPLTDITVDLAQIKTAKTLKVKQNRLFAANVSYHELEFDNGTPSVTSGYVTSYTNPGTKATLYQDDSIASARRGYWRDEVYRFAVLYTDKYGNKVISPLDLNGKITGNQITAGLPDMKFPSRATSNAYSIWSTTNKVKALGLALQGLTNHPTWAVSLEIVRVNRTGQFKDILFQTPLVPMSSAEGLGANKDYPTTYEDGISETTVADASPMTPGSVLVPQNLYIPELRKISRNGFESGSGLSYKSANEVKYTRITSYDYAMLFPPQTIYEGGTPFTFSGSEKIDVVDYCVLKLFDGWFRVSGAPTTGIPRGDFLESSSVGTFYAVSGDQYFFDPNWSGKSINSAQKNIAITEYEPFDTGVSGRSVAGQSTLDYEALQTSGISFWQYKPTVQKCAVVKFSQVTLSNYTSRIYPVGEFHTPSSGTYILGSSGPRYEDAGQLTNKYISEYAGWNGNNYISQIAIANVKKGLTDNRYGLLGAEHEYISTGAKYVFSDAEIATLQSGGNFSVDLEVWGGDCFVSSFTYKVCDSTYSITNQSKNHTPSNPDNYATNITKWSIMYVTPGSDSVMSIPVAVKNCAQFLQVVLESDFNGDLVDQDILTRVTTQNNIPVMGLTNEATLRTPLAYRYNININQQNSQRIYVPKPQYTFKQDIFKARIVYSDIKIYNSDQAGFDVFRVADFYDLEESRYAITKLVLAGDNLYAIQQRGVAYLPTGERQMEATDGGTLSVKSGDVIGRPIIIDTKRGSQHLLGIVETGDVVYIPDNLNKSVYVLIGQELKPLTENNEAVFRNLFGNQIDEKDVIGVYDPVRRDVYLNINGNCQVFNEVVSNWIGEYEFTGFEGGTSQAGVLYLLGKPSTSLDVYTAHTGNPHVLFGIEVTPRVSFYVNPDDSFSKTMEDFMIDSSDRLSTADIVVERESFLGNQTASVNLDTLSYEGNFRIKAPRDANSAKLRGTRALVTLSWGSIKSALRYFYTKYNLSARTPW